ncbi:MAG: gamma carbonic anhydrase family protein, partial [Acidobacteria bacterium]|nr:gamma carbonic anhydrase family protein [Acidobacteriota bacterium]
IGRRTNIQDGSVVHVMKGTHPTTLGDSITVGHAAILHGCAIQDRCLIGMGAILLNGAEVGTESIVAAGTLLAEGTRIPPRSLVMGAPGKVRRELTPEEVESIQVYADRYVEYARDYRG